MDGGAIVASEPRLESLSPFYKDIRHDCRTQKRVYEGKKGDRARKGKEGECAHEFGSFGTGLNREKPSLATDVAPPPHVGSPPSTE